MIVKRTSAKTTNPAAGIVRRVLAHTEKIMLTEHSLEKGAILPEHSHSHEQLVYLLSGELMLEMGGAHFQLFPGNSIAIPSGIDHKATALKESVVLDIFAPARMDYL